MSTSKSVRPSVSFDALITALQEIEDGVKFSVEDKANWVKVTGPNGHRIYIAKQAECRQVDISGFGADLPGTLPIAKPNGSVQAHLDLSAGEAAACSALQDLVRYMQDLPKTVRGGKAAKPTVVPFVR